MDLTFFEKQNKNESNETILESNGYIIKQDD